MTVVGVLSSIFVANLEDLQMQMITDLLAAFGQLMTAIGELTRRVTEIAKRLNSIGCGGSKSHGAGGSVETVSD